MGEKITGTHAIEEALKNASMGSTLYLLRGDRRNAPLEKLALQTGKTAIKKLSQLEFDKVAKGAENRGAVFDTGRRVKDSRVNPDISVEDFCASLKNGEGALVLCLDSITDPHNLGAILRSADQFSVALVIVPKNNSVHATEVVHRVSSGAASYVRMSTVTNLSRALDTLKDNGFWVYGADMAGEESYSAEFSQRSVIVMGSEGSGMRSLVRAKCDKIVSIPMSGHIDSLNVSVAAGILMYEYRRTFRN